MRGLFLSKMMAERHADLLERLSSADQPDPITPLILPEDPDAVVDDAVRDGIHAAFFSGDLLDNGLSRRFLGVVRRAPNLEWLHLGHAGTDAPVFQELMDRGVVVTNSSGVTAEPIAQTVMAGMLALHRGLPGWFDAQRRHEWRPRSDVPPDLRGQTMTVLGLGAIGGHVAHFSQAFGLHVIGVRRSPAGPEDGVDEWIPPDRLREVLPRTDWLAITIPLTSQTHHLIDAEALRLLPEGAHVLNVARGAIIDEPAMIEALRSGHLGGAYLDVFEEEPLPPESPLWDLPNVILSPHNAAPSAGNIERVDTVFREELERWMRGEPSPRAVRDR